MLRMLLPKSGKLAATMLVSIGLATAGPAPAWSDDRQIAQKIIDGYYAAASQPQHFYAPKNLAWIVDEYDSATLLRIGVGYLTGDGVEQDLEKAAIVLGGLHAVTTNNSYSGSDDPHFPRSELSEELVGALAQAARISASNYGSKNQGEFNFFNKEMPLTNWLMSGFLLIAAKADSQEAMLSRAYLYRLTRDAETHTGNRLAAASNEVASFRRAAQCTSENTSRRFSPWKPEHCEKAAEELGIAEQVYEILGEKHASAEAAKQRIAEAGETDFTLAVIVGVAVAIIAAAANSRGGQPMSDLEWQEQQRRYIEQQAASTWGHVGGALFVQ